VYPVKEEEEQALTMNASEVWRAQMAASERGDFEKAISYFDQDCEWRLVTSGKTYRGLPEVRRFIQSGLKAGIKREQVADVAGGGVRHIDDLRQIHRELIGGLFGIDARHGFRHMGRGVDAHFRQSLDGVGVHSAGPATRALDAETGEQVQR